MVVIALFLCVVCLLFLLIVCFFGLAIYNGIALAICLCCFWCFGGLQFIYILVWWVGGLVGAYWFVWFVSSGQLCLCWLTVRLFFAFDRVFVWGVYCFGFV